MKYASTRGGELVSLDDALMSGIAADGGLFMPQTIPQFPLKAFDDASSLMDVARVLLAPFFADSRLGAELDGILEETLSFPIPLTDLPNPDGRLRLLELFHGPTAAFKDVGAGFLAASLSRLQKPGEKPPTILVATSGDTGGAVAAAFDGREGIRVAVLFPEGRVSERQARQLCCWGANVLSLAVRGTFDDCQALVKKALTDPKLAGRYRFSSANSINIGRLLPQCTYYAHASLSVWRETGRKPGFVVPTGNLGNAMALLLTRAMGLPVGDVVLATNANRVIADYLRDGEWRPRDSVQTLATAMDVGDPSNMERVRCLFGDADKLRHLIRVFPVSDEHIGRQIREHYAETGAAICPHTATARQAWRELDPLERESRDWILVATAHAAKFEDTVEPLIGAGVPLPQALADILERPVSSMSIEPDPAALSRALDGAFGLDGRSRVGR